MKRQTVHRGLLWSGALLALPLAAVLRNPLLLQWRAFATPLLAVLAIAALLMVDRQWRSSRQRLTQHSILFGLWLSALALVAAQEGVFHWRKHQVRQSAAAEAQALGAHIIIGYSHPEEVRVLAQKGLVAGIFIGANTVSGRTAEAIAAEIAGLQLLRKTAGLRPLIVSTDQEGGIVSRMSPPLVQTPPLADIIAGAKLEDVEILAFTYGQEHGRGLAALGVNVNFAPLADLSFPRARNRLDFHSLIGQRAIAADPHRVSTAVIGYAHGLEAHGVRGTLKHFPGLGRVSADTHLFRAALSASESALEKSDWIPFREGLRDTQSLLMVGHATLSAVDAHNPASLSRKVVQGIVRDRWGHEGVLVTDDMAMAPVVRHGMCKAGVDAINAGMDLLLVSYDTDQYYTIMHCLLQARRDGTLQDKPLRASGLRLQHALGSGV
ncbi:MAG: glycoside hydrolase family 3 N-terminal domain-containing protein [Pseudomonadota bacterium]